MPELEDESGKLWDESLGAVAQSLLTAAVRCFASNGYHGTTTRDIASVVGLSPAALYVYFPSKELVLYEVIRTGHVRALEWITAAELQQIEDESEHLQATVARYTEFHARHHVIARVCQYDLAALAKEHYDEILQLRHETNSVFRKVVATGVDSGSFAEVDVKRVARAMLSLGIDLARWYRHDGSETPEQIGLFNAGIALTMVAKPSN